MAGPLKISDRLEKFVDSEARSLARAMAHGGRVRPQKVEAGLLNAKVEEARARTFVVWVRLNGSAFSYDCNCPTARSGRVCAHIYAVVLMAESMGVEGFRVRSLRQVNSSPADPESSAANTPSNASRSAVAPKPRVPTPGGPSRSAAPRTAQRDSGRGIPKSPSRLQTPAKPTSARDADLIGRIRLLEISGLDKDEQIVEVALTQWWQCTDQSLVMPSPGWDLPSAQNSDAETAHALSTLARAAVVVGEDPTDSVAERMDALRTGLVGALDPSVEVDVLPALCASLRARRAADPSDASAAPGSALRFRGRPWTVVLRPRQELADGTKLDDRWAITAMLRHGDEERSVEALDAVTRGGVVRIGDDLDLLQPPELAETVSTLRRVGGPLVEAAQMREFLAKMWDLPVAPELDLPAALAPSRQSVVPRAQFLVAAGKDERLQGRVRFAYGSVVLEEDDTRRALLDRERWALCQRDVEAEARELARLHATLATVEGLDETGRFGLDALPALTATLSAAGFEVWFEQQRIRVALPVGLEVQSGIDWFDVQATHDFGDGVELSLPELLRALDADRNLVALPDGSVGLLSSAWLARMARLLGLAKSSGDALRFESTQAVWVDQVLQGARDDPAFVATRCDDAFARIQQGLREGAKPHPTDPEPDFVGTLRPYQREGLGWLRFLADIGFGGILADDMGLGKTVQVLAHLHARRRENHAPSLVVAPRSVVHQWRAEAARFTPSLHVGVHLGTDRLDDLESLRDLDLLVTSYGVLRRDIDLLSSLPIDVLVLDEAQAVKNATTQTARAVRRLTAQQRLVVTGTPVENHLGELATHLDFLNPGLFGRTSALRERFTRKMAEDDARSVARALQPLLLRRTKAQVAEELPERVEQDLLCEMEGEQERLYGELREHYTRALLPEAKQSGVPGMQIQVLEALLRLRQVACHPGLVDPKYERVTSAKFDVLLPRLEELVEEGAKALVFSQFTKYLALLRTRLDKIGLHYEYLDGATRDREARIQRFQEDPAVPLFLISLKAGGVGLNLTAAQYVFLLDPWWNPAVEAQAIDRAHRHGQTSRVVAYRLLARGSVEEKIRELQQKKKGLAEAILGGDAGVLRELSPEDLQVLLG